MHSETRYFLTELGFSMENNLIDLTISLLCTGMAGIFTPLYIMAIYTILKRKGQSLHSWATLAIISFSLLTSLAYTALEWMNSLPKLDCFPIKLSSEVQCFSSNIVVTISMNWLSTLPLVFNDAIIVWRAWLIFNRQRWVLVFSVGLCICSFGVMMLSSDSVRGWSTGGVNIFTMVFFALSLLTNVVATLLIGMTLWNHLCFLKKIQILHQKFIGSWRILALLIESGVIYCAFQLVIFALQLALTQFVLDNYQAYLAFASLYRNISFVYPTLTILLIREVYSVEVLHNSIIALQTSEEHVSA
ncbi:hypothetical protein H2248_012256 [Termitomyces sp. 'cryptogamus']|nr:hypothetical protein H2248_012256 [Termitomyces sp. 'cryptogamus']